MPTTLPADRVDAAPSTSELFLDLLCADEDLLRDEFEAIVAAEWPSPPPGQPAEGHPAGRGHEGSPRPPRARPVAPPSRPRHPGAGERSRQRSPPAELRRGRRTQPPRHDNHYTRKAGDSQTQSTVLDVTALLARTFHSERLTEQLATLAPARHTHLTGLAAQSSTPGEGGPGRSGGRDHDHPTRRTRPPAVKDVTP
jgi:hypothetical protein